MAREIRQVQCTCEVSNSETDSILKWLDNQVLNDDMTILAYALDGVTEGYFNDGITTQQLSESTLTEIRLFNTTMEIYAWRVDTAWEVRIIQDDMASAANTAMFDEQYHHADSQRKITVRHYLHEDADGFVSIAATRLVNIS